MLPNGTMHVDTPLKNPISIDWVASLRAFPQRRNHGVMMENTRNSTRVGRHTKCEQVCAVFARRSPLRKSMKGVPHYWIFSFLPRTFQTPHRNSTKQSQQRSKAFVILLVAMTLFVLRGRTMGALPQDFAITSPTVGNRHPRASQDTN